MAGTLTEAAGPVPYNLLESAVVGGDRLGLTDSTAHFLRAVDKLPRGGVVVVPPGKYIAEGLPVRDGLYYVGAGIGKADGSTGTQITLPAVPSTHMFAWDGATTGYGGGVSGCYLSGGLTTDYDCITLAGATVDRKSVV